jgi:hypothetical protein
LDEGQITIKMRHVDEAIQRALSEAQQSTKSTYHKAVMSQRKDNLYAQVLLSCALADTDEMGYFAPADLREPMARIMKRPYDIANYIQHLNAFSKEERGRVLSSGPLLVGGRELLIGGGEGAGAPAPLTLTARTSGFRGS